MFGGQQIAGGLSGGFANPDNDGGSSKARPINFFVAHDQMNIYRGLAVAIIEIRPFRNRWKVFEAPGVEPVFPNRENAISYAQGRACFRSGEIRILDSSGVVQRTIPFNETDRRL